MNSEICLVCRVDVCTHGDDYGDNEHISVPV